MASTQEDLQLTLDTLQPERAAPSTPQNRLCVCISDVHFTDGTVGTQSAGETVWEDFFNEIVSTCQEKDIDELTLILDGDVVDMIRSAVWAQNEVYPWQRTEEKFKTCLQAIMKRIVELHAKETDNDKPAGFFVWMRQTREQLTGQGIKVEILVLLGNHDKEILADPDILKMFYEDCLGQPIKTLTPEYRRWIGKMYFNDEKHFAAKGSVPWLPFYWGDADLRLFVTHGQWRDSDNSRSLPDWQVKDGWRATVWQQIHYRPFTDPCFGDTVAAGVLSTFIYQTKRLLSGRTEPEIPRLNTILDELDLYRPTSAAIKRILKETRRKKNSDAVRGIIEEQLYTALTEWLSWPFTLESSPPARRLALQAARLWLKWTGRIRMFRIQFGLVSVILWILDQREKLLHLSVYRSDGASLKDMRSFPTFQKPFWEMNFRIHGEGHTHNPLESEADSAPSGQPSSNLTYINFGTWRDQIVNKENPGYRRRGVGRALYVLRLDKGDEPFYRYFVEDSIDWSDKMDKF